MIHAVEAVSLVSIEMEEIAGESKGYFDREARRIAVQENMSESQTLNLDSRKRDDVLSL